MPTRVTIDRFSHIGRSVLRIPYERRADLEVVALAPIPPEV